MTARSRVPVVVALALGLVGGTAAVETRQGPVKQSALLKLAEPWPDAETMKARRVEAEQRPLFAKEDALPFSLSADFKTINKDRRPEGKKDYPGILTIDREGGTPATLHVNLRTRGHFRLRATSCAFVPLRVEFNRDEVKGTIFDGQKTIKLITHCQGDSTFEQYVLREHYVYRVGNILTPRSFRSRVSRVTYVQTGADKPMTTRVGMFLEDDDDVARRMEGRKMEIPRALFKDMQADSFSFASVFEYMVGNTDWSLFALHNLVLVRLQDRTTLTVPYDFDMSGLVNAQYAIPDRQLGIKTVRDRLYRGPCRPAAEIEPVLDQFRQHKQEIFALYDSATALSADYRREAKDYLGEFFALIDRKGEVNRIFVDGMCSKKPTM
jgi:hypothetical protein